RAPRPPTGASGTGLRIPRDEDAHHRDAGRPTRAPAARGGKTLAPARPRPADNPRSEGVRRPATPPRSGRTPRRRDRSTAESHPGPRRDESRSSHLPFGPDLTNPADLALDGLLNDSDFLGDLLVGVALHLPECDASQRLIAQRFKQPSALLGQLGRELGSRL